MKEYKIDALIPSTNEELEIICNDFNIDKITRKESMALYENFLKRIVQAENHRQMSFPSNISLSSNSTKTEENINFLNSKNQHSGIFGSPSLKQTNLNNFDIYENKSDKHQISERQGKNFQIENDLNEKNFNSQYNNNPYYQSKLQSNFDHKKKCDNNLGSPENLNQKINQSINNSKVGTPNFKQNCLNFEQNTIQNSKFGEYQLRGVMAENVAEFKNVELSFAQNQNTEEQKSKISPPNKMDLKFEINKQNFKKSPVSKLALENQNFNSEKDNKGFQKESLYLRIATLIASKASVRTLEGKEIRTGIRINQFLENSQFTLEQFISGLQQFIDLGELDPQLKDDFKEMVKSYNFLKQIFKKFDFVFNKMDYNFRGCKEIINQYKNYYWLLFLVLHNETAFQKDSIHEAICILTNIFSIIGVQSSINSNYLNQKGIIGSDQISQELSHFFGINDMKSFKETKIRFDIFINNLKKERIIKPNERGSPERIEDSLKRLNYFYQKKLKPDEIDFRVFVGGKSDKATPVKMTAFNKKNLIIPDSKFNSQRILNYDLHSPKNSPEIKNKNEIKPLQEIKLNSNQNQNTKINFNQMLMSPYQHKLVTTTPMTAAMELYNWLHESVSRNQIYSQGELDLSRSEIIWKHFNETTAPELYINIENRVECVIEQEMKSLNFAKQRAPLKVFIERKTLILSFFYTALENFILKEEKFAKYLNGEQMDKKQNEHNIPNLLRNIEFLKTLLVFSLETVFFVLNSSSMDLETLLELVGIDPLKFYHYNLSNLNFESYVPSPLKNHFLNIEYLLISSLLWKKDSAIFTIKLQNDNKYQLVFNRTLLFLSSFVQNIGQALDLGSNLLEKIWEFTRQIFSEQREVFKKRYLQQIILCVFYSISKVTGSKIKFQDIISKFQETSLFSQSTVSTIIYQCPLNEDKPTDIITFYNKIFINELRGAILKYVNQFDYIQSPKTKNLNEQKEKKNNYENSEGKEKEKTKNIFSGSFKNQPQGVNVKVKNLSTSDNVNVVYRNVYNQIHLTNINNYNLDQNSQNKEDNNQTIDLMRSPLRNLQATPFISYNKDIYSNVEKMRSPTLQMMKMNDPVLRVPDKSRKIIDYSDKERNEGFFVKKQRIKTDEREQVFDSLEEKRLEENLNRFD